MAQIIELPDGTEAEFPDDMPQDQIERVLRKQFPSPKEKQGDRQLSTYSAGKIGGLPPEESELTPKEMGENVISGVELAGGLTPFSPLFQGVGEAARDYMRGAKPTDAALTGLGALGIDAALQYGTFGVGKLGVITAKQLVKLANKGIRPEILDEAIANPSLLGGAAKTVDKAGSVAYEGIKSVEANLGKMVHDAKAAAGAMDIRVNFEPARTRMQELKKSVGLVGGKDDILLETDKTGIEAFKTLDEFINKKFQKKILKENYISPVKTDFATEGAMTGIKGSFDPNTLGWKYSKDINVGRPEDLTRAQQALDNIDASAPFQSIYDKLVFDKGLSKAERAALEARNAYSKAINDAADVLFEKAGLGAQKQAYSEYKKLIDDPLIRLMQRSKDQSTSVVKNSMGVGRAERYALLRDLESKLPEEYAFMDDVIRNTLAGDGFDPLKDKRGMIAGAVGGGSKLLLRGAKNKDLKSAAKVGGSLIRRAAIDQAIGEPLYGGDE